MGRFVLFLLLLLLAWWGITVRSVNDVIEITGF